jgi:hypothetical protein
MIKQLFRSVLSQREADRQSQLRRKLMLHEARVGGTLFGEVPKNRRREFFCLDKHTWVWHEEWTDASGEHRVVTTRYDVRPDGILKSQNGSHYQQVNPEEATRLIEAANLYQNAIKQEVYAYAF